MEQQHQNHPAKTNPPPLHQTRQTTASPTSPSALQLVLTRFISTLMEGTARGQASPQPLMPQLFPKHHCGSPCTKMCCVQAQKTTHWWVLVPQFGTQTEVSFAEIILLWKPGFQTPGPCFPGLAEDKGQRRSLGDLGNMKILCKGACFKIHTPGQPGKLSHKLLQR